MVHKVEWYISDHGPLVCVEGGSAWLFRDGGWHRDDALSADVSGHSSASFHFNEVSRREAEKRFPEAFKIVPPPEAA